MYIKKESFLGIYTDDQIFVEYFSESEFEIYFRHSGPTGAMVYRFEGPEQKLISSQRRSYMGYSKPELDEKKNWKLFRDEFLYLSYRFDQKTLDEKIPAWIKRLYIWRYPGKERPIKFKQIGCVVFIEGG